MTTARQPVPSHLEQARRALGITQEALAAQVRCSLITINRCMRLGRLPRDEDKARRLKKALRLTSAPQAPGANSVPTGGAA